LVVIIFIRLIVLNLFLANDLEFLLFFNVCIDITELRWLLFYHVLSVGFMPFMEANKPSEADDSIAEGAEGAFLGRQ